MSRFVLTAQLQLRPPTNTSQVISQMQAQLSGLTVPITATGSRPAVQGLNAVAGAANNAGNAAQRMGKGFGTALRRFAAFAIAARAVSLVTQGLSDAVSEAIAFQREMVKISQVTGKTIGQLKGLENTITSLSTRLGASSKDLLAVTRILAQAGIQANDLDVALTALAKTTLAPTFDDITKTAEGAVAILAQFRLGVGALEAQLGAINAVAGQFAVESGDLIAAVRRTGGVFKAAGGDLNELLALFTSVRATTRESAESIATGLRTIFTRIQRPTTIRYLEDLGISLVGLDGKFVGPFEAIKRLSGALRGLEEGDLKFVEIAEQLGGFRQIGKVIPLLQQFEMAEKARQAAIAGGDSLTRDAATAQQALAVQMAKVKEEFLALIRAIANTGSFQAMVKTALNLASALIKVADAIKPIIPLIAGLGGLMAFRGMGRFASGLGGGLRGMNEGGKVHAFARGGMVPGSGNRDTVPAVLTPGEFVVRKSSVKSIGADNLSAMNNGYAAGGVVTKGRHNYGSMGPFNDKKPLNWFDGRQRKSGLPASSGGSGLGAMNIGRTGKTGSLFLKKGQQLDPNFTKKRAGQTTLKGKDQKPGTFTAGFQVMPGRIGGFILQPSQGMEGSYKMAAPYNFTIPPTQRIAQVIARQAGHKGPLTQPIAAQILPTTFPEFYPGAMEGRKNLRGDPKFLTAADAGTKRGLAEGIKHTIKQVQDGGLLDFAPALQTNENLMSSVVGKMLGDEAVTTTIEGYMFEAMIHALSGATPLGGQGSFDFPNLRTQGAGVLQRLTSLFGGSGIKLLHKAEAKRSKSNFASTDGVPRKLANDIKRGDRSGTRLVRARGVPDPKTGLPMATGGGVGTDTVPALLTPGEFVVNKGAAQNIGYSNLDRMNVKGYAAGGVVKHGRHAYGNGPFSATATGLGGGAPMAGGGASMAGVGAAANQITAAFGTVATEIKTAGTSVTGAFTAAAGEIKTAAKGVTGAFGTITGKIITAGRHLTGAFSTGTASIATGMADAAVTISVADAPIVAAMQENAITISAADAPIVAAFRENAATISAADTPIVAAMQETAAAIAASDTPIVAAFTENAGTIAAADGPIVTAFSNFAAMVGTSTVKIRENFVLFSRMLHSGGELVYTALTTVATEIGTAGTRLYQRLENLVAAIATATLQLNTGTVRPPLPTPAPSRPSRPIPTTAPAPGSGGGEQARFSAAIKRVITDLGLFTNALHRATTSEALNTAAVTTDTAAEVTNTTATNRNSAAQHANTGASMGMMGGVMGVTMMLGMLTPTIDENSSAMKKLGAQTLSMVTTLSMVIMSLMMFNIQLTAGSVGRFLGGRGGAGMMDRGRRMRAAAAARPGLAPRGMAMGGQARIVGGALTNLAGPLVVATAGMWAITKVIDAYTEVHEKAIEAIKKGNVDEAGELAVDSQVQKDANAISISLAAAAAVAFSTGAGIPAAVVIGIAAVLVKVLAQFEWFQTGLKWVRDNWFTLVGGYSTGEVEMAARAAAAAAKATRDLEVNAKKAAEELGKVKSGQTSLDSAKSAAAKNLKNQRDAVGEMKKLETSRAKRSDAAKGGQEAMSWLSFGWTQTAEAEQIDLRDKRVEEGKKSRGLGEDYLKSDVNRMDIQRMTSQNKDVTYSDYKKTLPPSVQAQLTDDPKQDLEAQELFKNISKETLDQIAYVKSLNYGFRELRATTMALNQVFEEIDNRGLAGFNTFTAAADLLELSMTEAADKIDPKRFEQALDTLDKGMEQIGASKEERDRAKDSIRGIRDVQRHSQQSLKATQSSFTEGGDRQQTEDKFKETILNSAKDPETRKRLEASLKNFKLTKEMQEDLAGGDFDKVLQAIYGPLIDATNEEVLGLLRARGEAEDNLIKSINSRIKAEGAYADAQKKAIDVQIEAAKIIAEFGGAKFTPGQENAQNAKKFNVFADQAGIGGLTTGGAADIGRVRQNILGKFGRQETQAQDAFRGDAANPFADSEGVDKDKREQLLKANNELLAYTKSRIGLYKQELDIVKKKNAAEKDSLDKLLEGDIEGFIKGQMAASAATALRSGDRGLTNLFSADALGAGFKTLEGQGLSDQEMKRAGSIALGSVGITDPRSAEVLAGATAEEEGIKSLIRETAVQMAGIAQDFADMKLMQVETEQVIINTKRIEFDKAQDKFDTYTPAVTPLPPPPPPAPVVGPADIKRSNELSEESGLGKQPDWMTEEQERYNQGLPSLGPAGGTGKSSYQQAPSWLEWMQGTIERTPAYRRRGGPVYANAGMFVPRGTDTIPAMLTPGEFVVNRAAVSRGNNLQVLSAMNGRTEAASDGYHNLGGRRGRGPTSSGGGVGMTAMSDFSNSLSEFNKQLSENLNKLQNTKFLVKLDPTDININLNGGAFLSSLKEDIKNELLAEVGTSIGHWKPNESGDLQYRTQVV